MYKRYNHIWLVAVIYFFILSLSIIFTLVNVSDMLERILEQMPGVFEIPAGIDENDFKNMLLLSLKISIVFSALFELAIMIIFLVKRVYFSGYKPEESVPPENQLPS